MEDLIESGVIDCVEGRDKINVEEEDVLVVELGIFYGVDEVSELSVAGFVCPESFLSGGKDVVPFCEEVDCSADVSCPELAKGIGHCNRSVVTQVGDVPFLVEEGGGTLHPVGGSVLGFPEELEESEGEGVKVFWCPLESFIG